jgi:4-hydroxybenzoyl-CoA reductase subunit beta
MRLPKMEHAAPKSVGEACSLLDQHGGEAKVSAGGTDVLVACKWRNIRPGLLVSLSKIEGLREMRFAPREGLRIGAMVRLWDVRKDTPVVSHYRALAQGAEAVGAVQLQHMGTLGGNLCLNTRCTYYNQSEGWRKSRAVCFKMGGDVCHVVPKGKKCYAVYSGDTAPALVALDAQLRLVSSAGERWVPMDALYSNESREPIGLGKGELVVETRLPPPSGRQGSTYLKYRVRGAIDFPLAGVAVRMNGDGTGLCTDCRVVLTAAGPGPLEVSDAGNSLKGKKPTEALIAQAAERVMKAAKPVANASGASPAYRRKMAGVLTQRALRAVATELGLL